MAEQLNKLETPNFNDPRVKRSMQNALGWIMMQMQVDDTKTLYCRDIASKNALGQAQTKTSKWLKHHLLICTNESFNKDRGRCKEYKLNLKGTRKVAEILNFNVFNGLTDDLSDLGLQLGVDNAQNRFDLDNIEYKEKSNRYWNPIQNMPKVTRNQFLANNGLTEQYDVECCAQTLTYQTYQRYSPKPLMMIEAYLEDRTGVRNTIAKDTGISVDAVKQLLTAMNNNSRLQASKKCSTFHLVDYSTSKVHAFNNHPAIVYLKADMTAMWKVLGTHKIDREFMTTASGITRKVRLNGSLKSHLYFSLEKLVMDIAYDYLDANNKKHFKLHDAFVTEPITSGQAEEITQLIKQQTGYVIKLEKSTTNTDK